MTDFDPLSVLLVTSGTRGERLLFRYPHVEAERNNQDHAKCMHTFPNYYLHLLEMDSETPDTCYLTLAFRWNRPQTSSTQVDSALLFLLYNDFIVNIYIQLDWEQVFTTY
jgi:hypothetical protein